MAENDLTGKVGLDTSDFKTAIAGMNRDIRVIESGFKASAAALGDWGSSASGLEMRIKALTGEIGVQQNKVQALTTEYKRIVDAQGENSIAAQNLEIRLNKETETLNKMGLELTTTEAGLAKMGTESVQTAGDVDKLNQEETQNIGTTNRLGAALSGLKDHLANAGRGFRELGDRVISVAKNLAIGLAAAITGAAIAIGAMVVKTAATADALVELSEKTGLSTTKLQELTYIGKQTGTELETVTGSLARLIKNMNAATVSTSPAAKAFASLGISVTDANGELRDSETVFGEALTALGQMTNETERDALAMALFGKSAQELNPLILAGADGMAKMAKEAQDLGIILSEEDVKAAADLNDKLAAMKGAFGGLLARLAGPFIPLITKIADKFSEWLKSPEVQKAIDNLVIGIGNIVEVLGVFVDRLLSGDVRGALYAIFPDDVVNTIMNIAKAVGDFITLTLIPFVQKYAPEIKAAVIAIAAVLAGAGIVALIASIANPIGLIVVAVGLLAAAWQGNWGGIRDITMSVVNWLKAFIAAALAAIQAFWTAHGTQIIAAVTKLWDGVKTAFNTAITIIKGIIDLFSLAFQGKWSELGTKLHEIISVAWGKIKETIKTLGDFLKAWIPELWGKVKTWFASVDWAAVGKAIVEGIWKGISNGYEWIKTKITEWVKNFLAFMRGLLGIKSPSTVFAEMGANMILGLNEGLKQLGNLPEIQLGKMAVNMIGAIQPIASSTPTAAGQPARDSRKVIIYGGVHLHGVTDGESLLESLSRLEA